jgi:predicted ferric reductase
MPWIAGYVALVLLPLAVALAVDPFPAPRRLLRDASVAFGLFAATLAMLQFALVSRLQPGRSFVPTDALMQFHRQMGIAAVLFALAHPLLLGGYALRLSAWSPFSGSITTRSGSLAFWALAFIVASSVARRRLPVRYEAWQMTHRLAAITIIGGSIAHAQIVAGYTAEPAMRAVLLLGATLFLALAIRYRLIRPLLLRRRPWQVVANTDAGGSTRLLRVSPVGHAGISFSAGQFAWLITGRTPLWAEQHPVSIACSDAPRADGHIEFAIKALGDWSGTTVPALRPGDRLWVDGPFGAFTLDERIGRAPGLVLIAGGIGIAPVRSLLLSLADRGERRPVFLFYAARDPSRVICRQELNALRSRLNLTLVYVFEIPADGWNGERGFIDAALLRRHLPGDLRGLGYFVCGPPGMTTAMERELRQMGIPRDAINTERLDMV